MKKLFLIVLISVGINTTFLMAQRQNSPPGKMTPGGNFEQVFDRFGNKYNLNDLRISNTLKPGHGNRLDENVVIPSYLLCSAGYFDIYFEEGSGFETQDPNHIARRAVICQLFNDLSAFIVPVNSSTKVNIWVRNIGNLMVYPHDFFNNGILGLATSFYAVPNIAPNTPVSGIIDGQIWQTINSGVDAYTNVTSPLITQGNTGSFYHGMMAFNFTHNWHTDLTSPTASGTYDLYSVALHEITHALGFASLLNAAGTSVLGTDYPYFSRYDMFLEDFSSAPLVVGTDPFCSMYDYTFNPGLDPTLTLAPNPLMNPYAPDYTDCLLAIKFGGTVNQIVYTPNYWEQGSSLSHFEDLCASPTPQPNNQYYCMANAGGTGSAYMQRYLQPEERGAMCDIGYQVNTYYGNTLYMDNNYTYSGSTCPGFDVAGANDGLTTGGVYYWTTTPSGAININGSDLLGNDYNADEFECLQVINNMGTVSITNGNNSTTVSFTAGATEGVALLRYIPLNTTTGNRGNITYLYVYITNGTCPASACNMLFNEGFENGTNCGEWNGPDNATISCWEPLIESPDYFVNGCTPANGDVTVPTGLSISNPATDIWNVGGTNNAFLGLGFTGGNTEEVEQTLLSNPMYPGVRYTVSFWAKSATGGSYTGKNTVVFRGDVGILAPLPSGSYATTGTYLGEVLVQDNDEWNFYTLEFINNAVNPLDNLMIGNMGYAGNAPGFDSYVLIDDVMLTPAAERVLFKAPRGLCAGETTIDDLSKFVFPAPLPGSTFSGTGVTFSGGIYSFAASGNGYYIINYNYTTANGCTVSIPSKINVTPAARPTIDITTSPIIPPAYCWGVPITLTASGANTYAWYGPKDSTGGPIDSITAILPCEGPCESVVVAPAPPGYKFSVIGTDSIGCSDSAVIYIPVVGCGGGGGGGNPPVVKTFEMPENVKHYTTKIVPGTKNYSMMAGTIFGTSNPANPGANTLHFLLLDENGDIIISREYVSTYPDERVIDVQRYTDKYKVSRWYVICHANDGGRDIIKVLWLNNWGQIRGQKEYVDNTGLNTYPMNGAVWTDGMGDNRLFITGYQTPPMGVPDYNTPKQVFLMSIDLNLGTNYMNTMSSYAYDFNSGWGSAQDFDMATRMKVLDNSNQLWITGSINGIEASGVPDRSATMNLVVDPLTGAVMVDNPFIGDVISDNDAGPCEYGIDLIEANGEYFILGNSANPVDANPAGMDPRPTKIWWIQPLDPTFTPMPHITPNPKPSPPGTPYYICTTYERHVFWNPMNHWAAHAISTGGSLITVATLMNGSYATCIPLPNTPSNGNVQVDMVTVDLSVSPPATWSAGPNKLYMTSTGTGSFWGLGGSLSNIDYPPTFAAKGSTNYAINAPKDMSGKLNLKVMTPDASLSIPCGEWDCNANPCPLNSTMHGLGTYFTYDCVKGAIPRLTQPPNDIQVNMNPSPSADYVYIIPAPQTCHDQAGNPSYRKVQPPKPEEKFTQTKIYPNPASDMVVLELDGSIDPAAKITVLLQNVLGQTISVLYEGSTINKTDLILPASVVSGVYVVQVLANDEVVLKEKLLIKK